MSNPAGIVARALVVDDEENISFLVASALRLANMEVRTASSGLEAIGEAERFGPAVIVLDVMLPDLDGFEVLRRLRSAGCAAPVLFLTARHTTAALWRDGVRLGPGLAATRLVFRPCLPLAPAPFLPI